MREDFAYIRIMQTVLITGGTGTIGKALSKMLLEKNYRVIILTRDSAKHQPAGNLAYADWNIQQQTISKEAIQSADYIIHLAGAGVADKRWTRKRKQEILNSRTQSSALLLKALNENTHHVKALVSASAIGWYGADPVIPNPKPFVESDPADTAFLGATCQKWEASISPVKALGVRLAICRTGIVLSNSGGAFVEFLRPLRFGIAPILGSGKQIISWIHETDLCRIYLALMENENFSGVHNAVAPSPLSNQQFMMKLGKKRNGNFFLPIPVPAFALKAVLGEMSIEILKSATVSCDKLLSAGFHFSFPSFDQALENLVQ